MSQILKNFLVYAGVFLIFFGFFYFIQFSFPNLLTSDDGYYHIKHAWLIRTQGIEKAVRGFSWLECSVFKEHPGDPWFGYHLLLLPFTFGDLTFGAKLSSVFFSSFLFLGFFWLLRGFTLLNAPKGNSPKANYLTGFTLLNAPKGNSPKANYLTGFRAYPFKEKFYNGVKYPLFLTFFLFLATFYFSFRLFAPRPGILAILFALIGFYLIFKKKYSGIFLLSFLFEFTTAEAPVIIFIAAALAVLEWLKTKRIDLIPPVLTILGISAALVFRPDFPHSFFLFPQTFNVLFLFFTGVSLDFGAELLWPFSGGVPDNIFLFLAFTFPLYWMSFKIFDRRAREIPLLYWSLAFLSLFFAGLTFKSVRFIEYWTPFSVLFFAVWFGDFFPKIQEAIRRIKEPEGRLVLFPSTKIGNFFQLSYNIIRTVVFKFEERFIKYAVLGLFLFLALYLVVYQAVVLSSEVGTETVFLKMYEEAASFLKENTPSGSVVLNASWDNFPILFFYNHHNHYCNGMDPTAMYIKDPKTYWTWRNLVDKGIICDNEKCPQENPLKAKENDREISLFLKEKLNGDYIFLLPGFMKLKDFKDFLSSSDDFEKIYKKGRIEIYEIKIRNPKFEIRDKF